MSTSAAAVFTAYFGAPHRLQLILLVMLVVVLGITIMILATKAMKDRRASRDFDDSDVFVVLLRGLAVVLLVAALFAV